MSDISFKISQTILILTIKMNQQVLSLIISYSYTIQLKKIQRTYA